MQIREQGQQVQLIRSHYDSTKKRCVQTVFCHFKRSYKYLSADMNDYLSAEQIVLLSDDEKKQLSDWLKSKSDKDLTDQRMYTILLADKTINLLADAILSYEPTKDDSMLSADLKEVDSTKIYDAIDRLKKAMKKKGLARVKKIAQEEPDRTDDPATIPGM